MTRRDGAVTIAELLLVFWLFGFVLAAMAGFAVAMGRLSAAQRDRARAQELVRTTRVVLRSELRHSVGEQLGDHGAGFLQLRAVRGTGAVCQAEDDDLLLRYRGSRQPDPDKDSVLLIGARGTHAVRRLLAVAESDRCSGSLRLRLDAPGPASPGLALVFEPGVYRLTDGALRYERGSAGRQPLTEPLLRPSSRFRMETGHLVAVLDLWPDSLRTISFGAVDSRVTILNRRLPP